MSNPQPSGMRGFIASFTDILKSPFALWVVIVTFAVESMSYFGLLTLMTSYISTDLKLGDAHAGIFVSVFTMLVTLFMLGLGSLAEAFGLRRAIIGALVITAVGRVIYCLAPGLPGAGAITVVVILALVIIAAGEAIIQPVCYSGVKQYTDEKTSAMGYGLIYAVMNLFIVAAGSISSWVRPAVQEIKDGKSVEHVGEPFLRWLAGFSGSGVQATNWVFTGLNVLTLLGVMFIFTRRTEAAKLRPDLVESKPKDTRTAWARFSAYFTEGPFRNSRFLFFIFMLLPVRTLFAHQWLTMPQYITRAYDKPVADKMEWLVNWINPAIIFIGVPIVAALTRRINVYTMMVIGSLVSAVPTFLLCKGPDLTLLIWYFVFFSIGEALWSARFLEYASELAPPGRIAQYMGLANIPWLLAKGTTGFYSGLMLQNYCPEGVPQARLQTGTMWFWYGCIAMMSPIGLWLARKWVMAGLHTRTEPRP